MNSFHYSLDDEEPTFIDVLKNILFYLQGGKFEDYHPDFHFKLQAFAPTIIETLVTILNHLNAFEPVATSWISFIQKGESLDSSNSSFKLILHFIQNQYHLYN